MRKQKLVSYGQIYMEYANTNNATNVTNARASKPKSIPIDISFDKNGLYKLLVASVSDTETLCIIAKYMYEKALPRLNLLVCHYMVLERVRQPELSSWCSILNESVKNDSNNTYCHVCQRQSMIYGVFCVVYTRHHEHVPLCINCGSKIERRGKRIFEIQGELVYGKLIRNFVLIKYFIIEQLSCIVPYLPDDILRIIMWKVYKLYDREQK